MQDIDKDYYLAGEAVHILKKITLTIGEGEYLSVLGPSGSGKSTLMNIIGCLDTPTAGQYILRGREVEDMDEAEASAGEKVKEEQELAEIAVSCAIRAEVSADDAGLFEEGQTWAYIRGDDPHEEMHSCTVSRVLADTGDASATVEFVPEDETLMPIGMGVTILDVE